MTGLLEPLSDAYLLEIAQHFAGLDLPYAQAPVARTSRAVLDRGRVIALQGDATSRVPACVQCHGPQLLGVLPNTPGLLGLPRDYLNAQMGAWRSGQRRAHAPDCMADIARALSTDDLNAVTAWLAVQPVPTNAKAATRLSQAAPMACGSAILPAGRARP